MKRTAVIKLGSSSVTGSLGPDPVLLASTLEAVINARSADWNVVLVSSGAVSSGRAYLSRNSYELGSSTRLAAAVGQPFLVSAYRAISDISGTLVCQILVSESDLKSSAQMGVVADVLQECFDEGIIPIVNGNDVTDAAGSDNDAVASGIAVACHASKLLLLTDVEGVYSGRPGESEILEDLNIGDMREVLFSKQGTGRGGMRSKLRAAEIAAHNGVEAYVASARDREVITKCLSGKMVGTRVRSLRGDQRGSHDRWISGVSTTNGCLIINREAEVSIRSGSSLFASGVKRVRGTFEAGDVVEITAPSGCLVARGVVRVSSTLLDLVRSMRVDELAHVLATVLREFYVASRRPTDPCDDPDELVLDDLRPQLRRALDILQRFSYTRKRDLAAQVMQLFPAAMAGLIFSVDSSTTKFEQSKLMFGKISSDLSLIERGKLIVL
ncbi:glutamate 5-kinase [Streptomyces griseorubiginosus]|uniref:glutamate 5-kinase n=1 Tax=Streptomyces griseorubiginosus TaxID=67304 RepID=UPI0036EB0D30